MVDEHRRGGLGKGLARYQLWGLGCYPPKIVENTGADLCNLVHFWRPVQQKMYNSAFNLDFGRSIWWHQDIKSGMKNWRFSVPHGIYRPCHLGSAVPALLPIEKKQNSDSNICDLCSKEHDTWKKSEKEFALLRRPACSLTYSVSYHFFSFFLYLGTCCSWWRPRLPWCPFNVFAFLFCCAPRCHTVLFS